MLVVLNPTAFDSLTALIVLATLTLLIALLVLATLVMLITLVLATSLGVVTSLGVAPGLLGCFVARFFVIPQFLLRLKCFAALFAFKAALLALWLRHSEPPPSSFWELYLES
jgi:hypothetical protein